MLGLFSSLPKANVHYLCFLIFFLNRVTAVDGKYQIGVYTLRPIAEGEEITFDYNSVTEVSTFLVSL